jgi:hypothetical protein
MCSKTASTPQKQPPAKTAVAGVPLGMRNGVRRRTRIDRRNRIRSPDRLEPAVMV